MSVQIFFYFQYRDANYCSFPFQESPRKGNGARSATSAPWPSSAPPSTPASAWSRAAAANGAKSSYSTKGGRIFNRNLSRTTQKKAHVSQGQDWSKVLPADAHVDKTAKHNQGGQMYERFFFHQLFITWRHPYHFHVTITYSTKIQFDKNLE
jgi:hypothetical protein